MTPKLNLAETYNLLKQIYESFFFEPFEIENREKKELLHSLIYYLKQQGISFFEEEFFFLPKKHPIYSMTVGDVLYFYQIEPYNPKNNVPISLELAEKLHELGERFSQKETFFEHTEALYKKEYGLRMRRV